MADTHLLIHSGIYAIQHLPTGQEYIGGSRRLHQRWYEHQWLLQRQTHWCPLLQYAWNRDGASLFRWVVLLLCPPAHLPWREQEAISTRHPRFNCTQTAVSGMQQREYLEACWSLGTQNPLLQWSEPAYEDRGSAEAIAARHRWIVDHLDDTDNDTENAL